MRILALVVAFVCSLAAASAYDYGHHALAVLNFVLAIGAAVRAYAKD